MTGAYAGTELELFASACNWKSYIAATLAPYIRGRVLDVGAGIGANLGALSNPAVTEWVALEPDPHLIAKMESRDPVSGVRRRIMAGTLASVPCNERFDAILYMDVLEHIADDKAEVEQAARLLTPGGCLIILVPAHQFLFSQFDAAIGHYRRYGARQLLALKPGGCHTEICRQMDSVGLAASLANRLLLRQSTPTARQIAVWDRFMVRASRVVDPIVGYRLGKSVLMVWRAGFAGNA